MKQLFGALILITVMLVTGCGKLTSENYDKIKTGMDYKEVVKILGEADKCESRLGSKACVWGNESKNIKINFLADKVIVFSKEGI